MIKNRGIYFLSWYYYPIQEPVEMVVDFVWNYLILDALRGNLYVMEKLIVMMVQMKSAQVMLLLIFCFHLIHGSMIYLPVYMF
jgi:hypothetical protein